MSDDCPVRVGRPPDAAATRLSLPARACNDSGPGGVCTWCGDLHTATISKERPPGPWIDRGHLRDGIVYCLDPACGLCDREISMREGMS